LFFETSCLCVLNPIFACPPVWKEREKNNILLNKYLALQENTSKLPYLSKDAILITIWHVLYE
jgi:hypothetical protein